MRGVNHSQYGKVLHLLGASPFDRVAPLLARRPIPATRKAVAVLFGTYLKCPQPADIGHWTLHICASARDIRFVIRERRAWGG
eukprot:1095744-Prymnesium_polylepis.1